MYLRSPCIGLCPGSWNTKTIHFISEVFAKGRKFGGGNFLFSNFLCPPACNPAYQPVCWIDVQCYVSQSPRFNSLHWLSSCFIVVCKSVVTESVWKRGLWWWAIWKGWIPKESCRSLSFTPWFDMEGNLVSATITTIGSFVFALSFVQVTRVLCVNSRNQSGRLYSLQLPVIYLWMLILLIWCEAIHNGKFCYQMDLHVLLNSCVYEDCWWFPFHGDRGRTAERTGYELHSGVSREATYQSGLVKRHHPVKKHSSAKADTSASLCDPPFAGMSWGRFALLGVRLNSCFGWTEAE